MVQSTFGSQYLESQWIVLGQIPYHVMVVMDGGEIPVTIKAHAVIHKVLGGLSTQAAVL